METSLKTGFAQIFSCCPKNLSCPKFGGAAAPLAPPARTPMEGKIARKHFYPANSQEKSCIEFSYFFLINLNRALKKQEKVDWNERYPINSLLLLAAIHLQRMCIQPDFFLKCTLQTMD